MRTCPASCLALPSISSKANPGEGRRSTGRWSGLRPRGANTRAVASMCVYGDVGAVRLRLAESQLSHSHRSRNPAAPAQTPPRPSAASVSVFRSLRSRVLKHRTHWPLRQQAGATGPKTSVLREACIQGGSTTIDRRSNCSKLSRHFTPTDGVRLPSIAATSSFEPNPQRVMALTA